jgi:hypothetical protein
MDREPALSACDFDCCTAQFVFMDSETYEETRLKRDEAWARYLKEGAEVALLFWNGKVREKSVFCFQSLCWLPGFSFRNYCWVFHLNLFSLFFWIVFSHLSSLPGMDQS